MRLLIFLFCTTLSFGLFGQAKRWDGELLVTKDSISFYSFDKKGVSEYVLLPSKLLKQKHTYYSKPLPLELKGLNFKALSAIVYENNEVYFLYPGGGILFKYFDGVFERVDESFAHRNQFSGYFFKYKKELFVLGGYGYWRSNSLLTKFNFETKDWDYVSAFGKTPSFGVNAGSFVLNNNLLYVFDFWNRIDDKDIKNNSLYILNLENFNWTKKGMLNTSFYSDILKKSHQVNAEYKNSLFQKNIKDGLLKIISPSENKLEFFGSSSLDNITKNAIIVGSNIVYPVLSADREYQTLTIKGLEENLVFQSEEYLTNDFDLFITYFVYAAVFCVVLIGITFFKFKKEKFVFFISDNRLNGLNKSVQLNEDEKFVLELISKTKDRQIENSFVLNYFKNSKISIDASVKRKNKTIDGLNRKVMERFEVVLINKRVNKNDSRQFVYSLNPYIDL